VLVLFDIGLYICYNVDARRKWSVPGEEVEHDTETSVVMPMGVSLSGLSGDVGRSGLR